MLCCMAGGAASSLWMDVVCCVADLCDEEELRQAVLSLLDEIQHKRLSDLHSSVGGVDRHSSSLRR